MSPHSRVPRPYHLAGTVPLSLDSVEIPAEAVARFLARLEPAGDGCMVLRRLAVGRPRTSSRPKEYAKILWNDEAGNVHQIKAHRLALMIKLGGPIPEGMLALHRCDHQACNAASHLVFGDAKQNMADRNRAKRIRAMGLSPSLHPVRRYRSALACVEVRPG